MAIPGINQSCGGPAAASAATDTTAVSQATHHHRHKPDMKKVADVLGMSTTDLQSALKSGKSLTDIAAQQGVASLDSIDTSANAAGTKRLLQLLQSLTDNGSAQVPSWMRANGDKALDTWG